jgi:hypothetical protein
MAVPVSIELTSDALGLGGDPINVAKNGDAVEADRPGQLVMSTDANVGSILTIQADGTAGAGEELNPLLVTVTARTHLDTQLNIPAGADFQAGVIYLSDDNNDLPIEGLGVRAFGIDMDPASATYAQRYVNPAYVALNGHGFQLEGSKEISGGFNYVDWNDFAAEQPTEPGNTPPHVDEDVMFDFNNADVVVPVDGVSFLLTKIKAGDETMDLAVDLTVTLVGGATQSWSFEYASDDPCVFTLLDGYDDVLVLDLGCPSLGFGPNDILDSVVIGARDDPADPLNGTDEHFLINGFSVDYTNVPEPATMSLLALGGLAVLKRK